MADQLTAHHAARVEFPGPFGPIAALAQLTAPSPRATLLLIPGYTGSKEDFAPILDPLAVAGFRAFAIDLPGQYESPGPTAEERYLPASLGSVVADLIARLAATYPGPVIVLGHSFGGLVARRAVLSGARVAGLILLCSGPAAFTGGPRLQALKIGAPVLRMIGMDAAWSLREQVTDQLGKVVLPALTAFRRNRFLKSTAAGLLGMGEGLQTEPDLSAELAAAGVPVAVIAGVADDAWPLDQQRSMAERLGTSLVLIQAAAHSPAIENPVGLVNVLTPLLRQWSDSAR